MLKKKSYFRSPVSSLLEHYIVCAERLFQRRRLRHYPRTQEVVNVDKTRPNENEKYSSVPEQLTLRKSLYVLNTESACFLCLLSQP